MDRDRLARLAEYYATVDLSPDIERAEYDSGTVPESAVGAPRVAAVDERAG